MTRIHAISDLHLSLSADKPMDVFGPGWERHVERIRGHWLAAVAPEDIVLVSGDLSWAMRLQEAAADLAWLAALPGRKVCIKGNHDYWWSAIKRVRAAGGEGVYFLQNDSLLLDGIAFAGTRLWDFPGISWRLPVTRGAPAAAGKGKPAPREGDPEKIRARELRRLRLSLGSIPSGARLRIAMTHYPPVGESGGETPITRIMEEFGVDLCVYGHLHGLGEAPRPGADCRIGRTRYVLASCDWLKMRPLTVWDGENAAN